MDDIALKHVYSPNLVTHCSNCKSNLGQHILVGTYKNEEVAFCSFICRDKYCTDNINLNFVEKRAGDRRAGTRDRRKDNRRENR